MRTFQIENTRSGVILGEYPGKTAAEALDALARDAGYRDYADLDEQIPEKEGEILVTEIPPPELSRPAAGGNNE